MIPETLDDAVNVLKRLESLEHFMYQTHPQKFRENIDLFFSFSLNFVNMSIKSSTFPSVLKLLDISPGHKKDSCYQPTVGQSVS